MKPKLIRETLYTVPTGPSSQITTLTWKTCVVIIILLLVAVPCFAVIVPDQHVGNCVIGCDLTSNNCNLRTSYESCLQCAGTVQAMTWRIGGDCSNSNMEYLQQVCTDAARNTWSQECSVKFMQAAPTDGCWTGGICPAPGT